MPTRALATIPQGAEGRRTQGAAPVPHLPARRHDGGGNGAPPHRTTVVETQLKLLLSALRAVEDGDFSVRLAPHDRTARHGGDERTARVLEAIARTFNRVVGLNEQLTRELVRMEQVVGREGCMTERATLPSTRGGWGKQVGSVNALIEDLVQPTTEVARVISAVAEGDLTQKMVLDIEGQPVKREFLRIGTTVNAMVDQLSSFAAEVTRVAKEVGTDGKLGGQAEVKDVSGTWKDLTDNVNLLANNLTAQVRNIADVTTSVANGDLSKKITVDARGELGELKETINTMVDQLRSFASEVTRVAKEVGTDGNLGGQADVRGVSGVWKDLTDNVNFMASNLTTQVRGIVKVVTAVANGDLSQKLQVHAKGEVAALAETINSLTTTLGVFAEQVTSVAKTVGVEGKLGAQAEVKGVAGTWKDLTDNVNLLANNLTAQVRNIAEVSTAVAKGDLSKKITVDARGEVLELKSTINTMVDQLRSFAAEVTRVAKEVGTDGKLGGQADVKDVSGVWKDLTDNVNFMASNLTTQVRGIVKVVTSVANGDLSQRLVVDAKGEIAALADTLNSMTTTLQSFASEVTRVAKEVGTEGKLGGQADVKGVSGTWKDLTDNVNFMARNLTDQVRNIAKVSTGIANGDLSQKITVEASGEIFELKRIINVMVDQLRSFASEVTRVAREVGTEGKLGGQADVKGVSGTWKDLTDSVNFMASNLTNQVRNIAKVSTGIANGNLSQKITVEASGEILELKSTINVMVDQLRSFASEVTRVSREVGTDGKLGGQAEVPGVAGIWKHLTDNVNSMASNLTTQVRGIVKVVTAVADGDLTQKLVVEAKGEVAALAETINSMTNTLGLFAEQVSSVAREVGVEGKLGGQARVPGVAGTWKDLTDNVNFMASNLTTQVRGIVKVVTAVANGDLSQRLVVDAKGEVAALAETINSMTTTLGVFAEQVSTVAREVGIEGKLGGQAKVPGAVGTWRQLTDNVNQLAGNLTTQVRAISEVATAVTKGDLTRSITVEAQGEVASLKDNINQMIVNLKETTQKNAEQDWLKTNLAKFSGMMQGQKNLQTVSQLIMSELTPLVSAHYGAFFIMDAEGSDDAVLKLTSSYAYRQRKHVASRFRLGEGLVGQCALEKKPILLTHVPPDYVQISSGLGEATPLNIIVLPVLFEGGVKAVIELASFCQFSAIHQIFLDQLTESIGVVLNMISASMRTEELLLQSQGLTQELQSQSKELTVQQEELKRSNAGLERQALELEDKARLLEQQNRNVEVKNREVEQARVSLEEKAEQLALISKYKSEFLANMSHELRTPLNSLLILAKLLADNKEANLNDKQIDYARTIHASGVDLLALINEILDLSRVEAGKMKVEPSPIPLGAIKEFVERSFRAVAEESRLAFAVDISAIAPATIVTDSQRLQQVLKNLLANAFKFTEHGGVTLRIDLAPCRTRFANVMLAEAAHVVAFSVTDTGIGISKDKQKLIFEAFQQADGTTNRKYGGTGLGLSISREIAKLLGGEIHVQSSLGAGSTFTLYLPQERAWDALQEAPPESVAAATATPLAEDTALTGKKVLVIDDDVRNVFALTSVIESHDAEVVYALDGRAGIEALRAHRDVNVVLLDVMMPEMDGYETIRAIRREPAWAALPVVAVTAKALKEDRDKCLETGATDYLSKPVDGEKLLELLRRWTNREGRLHMTSEPSADALASATQPGVTASVLIVDDSPANLRALQAILDPLAIRVVEAGSGAEALERVLAEDFAVILMDVRMPGLSGLETAALIKQRRRSRDVPIVFLSAIDRDASYVARGYRHGAVDYLIKPYEPEILRSKVTVFVDLYLKGERIKWQAALLHERERAALLLAGEQEARRQAEEASRLKDEFLAVVSHELRTPLTAILGWAQLLRAGARSGVNQARALEAIERNAAAQARLVGDLLDVSRIVTGKLNLEPCSIDLPAVVLAAVDAVRPAAQAKDIALDVTVDGDLDGFEGDADRLQQVCGNLLTNAVKFTPRSGHVGVRLAERDGAAELAVTDTGQGISASFLPHVFERFRQADTTSTRAHGGLGLGLALVRTLVGFHGGTVRAASPGEGKGSVFTVTLPRRSTARARSLHAPDAPAATVLDGVKVLVVDDEPDARELIAAALESCGAEVRVAASALDALAALAEAQPHVLLSDLGMPHEDGYALIRRVRSLDPDRGGAIPAAALTAYAGPEIGQRARAAGFQVHLAKPVEPSRIAAVVAELAQRRRVA